ncbi:hypothetical protein [Hydrogenophaga sp.]|nr:hypothetical protein [Hydrogenophaga sp.]MDP3886516.1 hypothetical protein [Hydrogenophaga sp.]MDZ4359560.1 hypothetical protein [Variovorax sp.]
MSDWKHQQMIKASGWPLAADLLAPDADFTARLRKVCTTQPLA